MSHITVRKYQTTKGLKWVATEATFDNSKGYSVEKKIDELALQSLGFSSHMTPDQARAHAKKLNKLNEIKRKEQASQIKAAERLTDLGVVENSIIPDEMSRAFVEYMEENWYGGLYNLRKQIFHWNKVQKILTALKVQPHEYFKEQKKFYKYFQMNGISKSYMEKLLKVINLWGDYYSEQSRTYFKRLPGPKGVVLEAIVDASEATGEGAHPLDQKLLSKMNLKLPPGQWEYMHATLWLGLRPTELDDILENKSHMKVSHSEGVEVLSIYQTKLTSVPKPKRWKHIPIFHPEMERAVEFIQNGVIRKPLVKTLKKAAPGYDEIGLYSGRKGFTDLMLSLDQKLEDISMWLGHLSIERTWKNYKDKKKINFQEVKIKAVK